MHTPAARRGAPVEAAPDADDSALRLELDRLVQEQDLVLFMKGTPAEPRCPFSGHAAQLLNALGHPYQSVDVHAQADPAAFVHTLTSWSGSPHLPQVWVRGQLVAGPKDLEGLVEGGELHALLAAPRPPPDEGATPF